MRTWFSFLVPITILAAATAAAQNTPELVAVSHIRGPLHLLRCIGQVAVVASVGTDGILLVDSGYGGTAEAARGALADLGTGPVRIIVNSHGDGDHVGGNAVLGEDALILSHPYVRRQMGTYFALPAQATEGLPALTLDQPVSMYFNGDEIRLLSMPGGHTAGDLVVHFTGTGVACVGDLVLSGTFPDADPGRGGDAKRLAEVIRELIDTLPANTLVVPGHGAALTMSELSEYLQMVEATTAAVQKEVQAGHSLAEILELNPLAPWTEWESPEVGLSFARWTAQIHASLSGDSVPSICAPLTETLVSEGVEAAVARYRNLKETEPYRWNFAENQLNMLGYQLLQRDMTNEAITIFELNVEAFPDAFNAYDSLGEAYLAAGKRDLAITNYQRSLELNPDNSNAAGVLAELRGD